MWTTRRECGLETGQHPIAYVSNDLGEHCLNRLPVSRATATENEGGDELEAHVNGVLSADGAGLSQ